MAFTAPRYVPHICKVCKQHGQEVCMVVYSGLSSKDVPADRAMGACHQ